MCNVFVIIPVYNVGPYLERCLNSLLKQTYFALQIVLVNDGSTDSSPAICDKYAAKYAKITVIHQKNSGVSTARNAGLSYCLSCANEGDYVTFVDGDDYIAPRCIEYAVKLCKEKDCQMVQWSYKKGNESAYSFPDEAAEVEVVDRLAALLGYQLKSQCCAKLYQLSLFQGETFRKGVLNEDEFMTYRVVYKCRKVAFSSAVLYYYFQRESSIMHHIASALKDSGHREDWLWAYMERIEFFEKEKQPDLVLKTYEKICVDLILRYTEQMLLSKEARDPAVRRGEYTRMYRIFYRKMMGRSAIPFLRKMIYRIFYIYPYSAALLRRLISFRR